MHDYPVAARLADTTVPPRQAQLSFTLRKEKLRQIRQREGRYLLRTNITGGRSAEELWEFYIQLTEVEAAFNNLKDDLALRPIYHQLEHRIEARISISFLAYCLHVALRRRLRDLVPGLTPRSVLEKFATKQMLDVHLPTTDERAALHASRNRCSTSAATTQTVIARPTTAQNQPSKVFCQPRLCSEHLEHAGVDL